jgi:hypothetical protein
MCRIGGILFTEAAAGQAKKTGGGSRSGRYAAMSARGGGNGTLTIRFSGASLTLSSTSVAAGAAPIG